MSQDLSPSGVVARGLPNSANTETLLCPITNLLISMGSGRLACITAEHPGKAVISINASGSRRQENIQALLKISRKNIEEFSGRCNNFICIGLIASVPIVV
ncbi:MAG: hypothetical protein LW713_00015 [Acetobacteraceae bacterium]|jgi:hypothetical protein|nr:hypothetical protein [Acetobacteraceae bacterium]